MDLAQYTFSYTPANLQAFSYAFSLDHLFAPIIIVGLVILFGVIYLIAPYMHGYLTIRHAAQEKQDKRRIIQDLILMKEIQGELEQEMEQTLLNAAIANLPPKQA